MTDPGRIPLRGPILLLGSILLLAGCAGDREETREEVEASAIGAPGVPLEAEETRDPVAPPTEAEIQRMLAADDSLQEEFRLDFERRRASMGSYEECVRGVQDLPDAATRARIEAACRSRAAGP
jgi:hypothetical protein